MIKEYYNETETVWSFTNGKFTAYLRNPQKGKYILQGHANGTPREADQSLVIPPSSLAWAERAAKYYLAGGILPVCVDAEIPE